MPMCVQTVIHFYITLYACILHLKSKLNYIFSTSYTTSDERLDAGLKQLCPIIMLACGGCESANAVKR